MTANAMEGDRDRCLAAGMNDYTTKPVDMQSLATVLERWLPHATETTGSPGGPAATNGTAVKAADGDIDFSVMEEAAHGDAALLRQLIVVYLQSTQEDLDRLAVAVSDGDFADIEHVAHTCAGGSATCGITSMVEKLRDLERVSRDRDLAAAAALQTLLRADFERVQRLLNERLGNSAPHS
jgi:HPt (histidine-containing phosphotransfer) domain-containing protein